MLKEYQLDIGSGYRDALDFGFMSLVTSLTAFFGLNYFRFLIKFFFEFSYLSLKSLNI